MTVAPQPEPALSTVAPPARELHVVTLPPGDDRVERADLPVGLHPADRDRIAGYLDAATAANTRRAYAVDWRAWEAWCARRGVCPLPAAAETLAAYLAALAHGGASPATVARRATGIAAAHRAAGLPSPSDHPAIRRVLRGVRRAGAAAGYQPRKAAAAGSAQIRALVDDLDPTTLGGVRDRAMVLVGFALGLRASDLVGLDVTDLTPAAARPDGLDVRLRKSKTDQEGVGVTLALAPGLRPATCPVRAVRDWLAAARAAGMPPSGPLFRAVSKGSRPRLGATRMAPGSVSRILRRAARGAGLDADSLSSHSLRRGYATAAYQAGVPEREIARDRWRSVTVLRSYDASGRWQAPASGQLGL